MTFLELCSSFDFILNIPGMESKGNGKSSSFEYIVMNSPSKVKSAILMEDLGSWKSIAPAIPLSKETSIASLKSISALHAKFWKDKKMIEETQTSFIESDTRAANSSKISYYLRKQIVNNVQKYSKKIEGEWKLYKGMRLPKTSILPDWMTVSLSGNTFFSEFTWFCYIN